MDFFDILLAKKLENDQDPTIEGLSVTENGRYEQEGVVYKPVIVNVPQPTMRTLNATANGQYTPEQGEAYNEVNVAVPLPANAYLLKELSNLPQPIASFNDGADAVMQSLKVDIKPVQDLHGYDSPWAGGAGKNKLDFTDTTITSSRTIASDISLKAGDYVVSFDIKNNSNIEGYYLVRIGTTGIGGANFGANYSGRLSKTFTLSEDSVINIFVAGASSGYSFEFSKGQIEAGSTATTYAPYSNICPISGWTGCEVNVTGVNVWDEEWEVGRYNSVGQKANTNDAIRTKNHISVKPNTSYYIHNGTNNGGRINYYDVNKQFISAETTVSNSVRTTPSNCYYITYSTNTEYGATYKNDISINYPSTDTEYHAYNGTTTTIPFTDSQGNPVEVFGGSVDVVNGGEQPRTFGSVDLGMLNYSLSSSINVFYSQIPNMKSPTTAIERKEGIISSMYPVSNSTSISANMDDKSILRDAGYIYIRNTDYTSESDFKTAMSGVQLRYELATPTTFYTQPTSIKSLDGENNVGASTGDVTECEYFGKESS